MMETMKAQEGSRPVGDHKMLTQRLDALFDVDSDVFFMKMDVRRGPHALLFTCGLKSRRTDTPLLRRRWRTRRSGC